MRKLFNRDKPTLKKVTPAGKDITIDLDASNSFEPDFYWTSSRSSSPFPGTTSVRPSHPKEPREGENARRDAAAVGILNALNPQFSPPLSTNVDATTRSLRDDETLVYAPSEGSIREENRERGGFWVWSSSGGERDRDRRDREEGPQDLMRMIGYLTATSSEDWAVVLDVCERASATEANAKEAAKALRREFKFGDAPQQLSAARLWAIMLRNTSEIFVHQCMKSKFINTLEDVLTSQRTSPVVRERLLDVLAAAAYASSEAPGSSFCVLWKKVKPPGKPDEGVPFDPDDATFNPPSPRRSSSFSPTPGYPPVHLQSLPPPTLPHSQFSKPPLRASPPTPPPAARRERLPSFDEPVDAGAKATQPIISIIRTAPTPATEASASGANAHPTSALSQSEFTPLAPSGSRLPPVFLDRIGGPQSDGDGALTPASARWGKSKRQRTNLIEQEEGYTHTRSRVIEAVGSALATAASIGHEALFTGVDLLQFAPVPGLNTAGAILLKIWDAIEIVETNRRASLRLAERCADILISIRSEIADAGFIVAEELHSPIAKLVDAFKEVHVFLDKLGKQPFLKRYLRRNEILSGISACDSSLTDALGMFDRSILLRVPKLVVNELRRQKETHDLFESVSHASPSLPPADTPSLPAALQLFPPDPESVHSRLHALRASQNAQDRAYDMANLHQLMRAALAANDDMVMIEVLQIARSEMPDAIKTLERALEHLIENAELYAEESNTTLPSQHEETGKANVPFVDPGASHSSADTLDHEFIKTGINALRRLSKGADLGLPSWTITRFEIDLEAKIGIGFFSDVYRGTWRKHTVAIKVLSEATPHKIFLREVEIWKSLHHLNVLELFGASSASGDPPWFLVSKYYPRGNLVKYLKSLSGADAASVNVLKMVHEISKGMAHLHKQGVLHGDLKAANILVDDDTRCVVSDFGQSEMKSEVYRITCTSQPRGTLRWQAPELMQGDHALTQEMDVYAFAICCWEILTMGDLPWPFMDESAVRHSVLNENRRPAIPPSSLVNDQLINVIRVSWDRVPSNRPSFEQIARELNKQRCTERP